MYKEIIGFLLILTLGCIIKKVKHPKSVSGNFLWLIIYNDIITGLSFLNFYFPSPGYDPSIGNPTLGYIPMELIILSSVPLLMIGVVLKAIYFTSNQEVIYDDDEMKGKWGIKKWFKESIGSMIYIVMSVFPVIFTLILGLSHFRIIKVEAEIGMAMCIFLAVLVPFIPRIYNLRHINK